MTTARLPVSLLFIDAPPGRGPGLHTHAYHELFIVQEGTATFTADDEERVVHAGDIVIVPPGTPHRFENTGEGPLRHALDPDEPALRDRVACEAQVTRSRPSALAR